MKNMLSVTVLTLLCLALFSFAYPAFLLGVAQLAPHGGKGESIEYTGRKVGYANVGQSFENDSLFWSRPSAAGYNAAASSGSNKGPNNPDFLKTVEERVARVLEKHPYLKRENIPADLVTASGSGLDPHLSPASAAVQVRRVAQARGLSEQQVAGLVNEHTERSLWGLFGPEKVNVLKLNLDLVKKH